MLTSRSLGLMALVLTALLVAVAGAIGGSGDRSTDRSEVAAVELDAEQARAAAATACRWLRVDLPDHVARDAPADGVLDDLAGIRAHVDGAARVDVSFVALASGFGALEQALYADDPAAADIAMRVIGSECTALEMDGGAA